MGLGSARNRPLTLNDQYEEVASLCDRLTTCVDVGLGRRWCDHATLVSLAHLTRSVLGERAGRSPCFPWHDGILVTYEQALDKAHILRATTAARVHDRARAVPVFLTTLSAAAIAFLVAAHGASKAIPLVQNLLAI